MTQWHAEYAWLGRTAEDVLITTSGQEILSVEEGAAAPPGAERLRGLTIPGLANVHSHVFHRALRGRSSGSDFWSWREEMYEVAKRLVPDSYYRLARATYVEMALSGITAVGEFHYLHHGTGGVPYDDPNEMANALIAAAADAGIRLTLIDVCYLRGGFDAPVGGAQLRFCDVDVSAWAQRASAIAESDRVKAAAAAHSVRAVDAEGLAGVARFAVERGASLHVHVSEQPAENEQTVAATGMTPVELLESCGFWEAGGVAIHATHLTHDDEAVLGHRRARVCLCPTTERDLGDGVGAAAGLVAAGASLCLGTDSNVVIDVFQEARLVDLHERLAGGERGLHQPADLLEAATSGGMAALGWSGGRIEPRGVADFVTVDLDSVRTAGARAGDPSVSVVSSATASDVTSVVVGGDQIVRDGHHSVVGDAGAVLDETLQSIMGSE